MVRVISTSCLDRFTVDSCLRDNLVDGIVFDESSAEDEFQSYLARQSIQRPPVKPNGGPIKLGKKIS